MLDKQKIYRLRNLGLPPIEKVEDLANEMRLSISKVRYLAYRSHYLYKTYQISKKNGSPRVIAQPNRELKAFQSWILRNILDKLSSSEHSKGFEKNTSILDNASPHVGSNYVLTIDLEDFFPSIKVEKVYSIFYSIGYSKLISSVLASVCTFDGSLPQGAPTSPKLANLICAKLDARLYGYAGPRGIVYTRYADDITFSAQTAQRIYKAKEFVNTVIFDEGFNVNHSKTKISGTQRQKRITGLIVSEHRAGIGRQKYRQMRVKLHRFFSEAENDFNHINGMLAFIYDVDPKMYKKLYLYINSLIIKYPDNPSALLINKEITKGS
ncbi:retron St85 family RNA-directed DNA polymerase [Vreelandella sp. TE19]